MYELRIYKKAEREIKKAIKVQQAAIVEALSEIQEFPLSGKPLERELSGRFSYRVGNFRIIYKVNEKTKTIFIVTVGHRSTVYN